MSEIPKGRPKGVNAKLLTLMAPILMVGGACSPTDATRNAIEAALEETEGTTDRIKENFESVLLNPLGKSPEQDLEKDLAYYQNVAKTALSKQQLETAVKTPNTDESIKVFLGILEDRMSSDEAEIEAVKRGKANFTETQFKDRIDHIQGGLNALVSEYQYLKSIDSSEIDATKIPRTMKSIAVDIKNDRKGYAEKNVIKIQAQMAKDKSKSDSDPRAKRRADRDYFEGNQSVKNNKARKYNQ